MVQGVIGMAKYILYMHYGHPSNYKKAEIEARSLDEFRSIAIRRYGNDLNDRYFGNSAYVVSGSDERYIGSFLNHHGAWIWNPTKIDSMEINPFTGGKMVRYEKGYDVKGTTADGKKLDTHFKFDGIDYLRSILMNQSNYGDRRKGTFTISRDGKKLGTITMASNGRWVWTSVSGSKYYIDVQGKLGSQIRRSRSWSTSTLSTESAITGHTSRPGKRRTTS